MREVITYVAFDDAEFDMREKCLAYENKCRDYCRDLVAAYDFYDRDGQHIEISGNDVETMLSNIDYAYQTCEYVRVYRLLDDALEFLYKELGFDVPNELGYFKYDFYREFGGGWQRWD